MYATPHATVEVRRQPLLNMHPNQQYTIMVISQNELAQYIFFVTKN